MIDLIFKCGGCDAQAVGTGPLRRCFERAIPTGGFGVWKWARPETVTPEGWVAADPYTGCCYCPTCWAGIEGTAPIDHSYSAVSTEPTT